MFKEVADIKTSDQLHLPVPEAKFETVVAKPSEIQKEMVQELSKRAAEIHSGAVDASVDNMLCVTNDGRKIGLDVRLMNPMLPDDPNSKLNVCVQNVLKIWEEGKDQKLTQLLFCDLSTPKNDGNFNVYDDIRKKLIAAGVPENEIEFIHNADTEAKKAALFSKVRSGDVRVLLGSTAKMGAGTNVQSRLVAVHHLDVGWKPSDMTQRNGRIIRQGNMNKEVKVFNYVTEGTFDSYLFQTLENKQRFISQIMTSKSPVRSCEDVDEQALSYAEIKALCAGNPLIKEKMDLDVQVAKLKVLKADHQSQKFRLQDKLLTKFPADIQETNAHIAGLKADAQLAVGTALADNGLHGGHEDAQGPDVRVGDLADGLDGLQHDVVALDGVFIHLDGDEDVLNGHQHVDIEQALQRGGAVEKHEIVSIGDLGQEAAQGGIPAEGHLLHGGQRRSQQAAAPDQVEVFGGGVADGVRQRGGLGHDDVRQRGGGDLRQGQVAGGVALSIHVHDQNLFALECKSEVNILWKENCRRYPSKCVLEAYNR